MKPTRRPPLSLGVTGILVLVCLGLLWWPVALRSACGAEADDGLVEMVISFLHEKDKEIRSLALEQVRTEVPGADATQRLAAELPKLPAEAQPGLLSALADRGDRVARPAVLELLEDTENETVRVAAIEALGHLGVPGDTGRLIELLADGDESEKVAARDALTRLSAPGVPELIVVAARQLPPAQAVPLIEILTERRALQTMPDLLQLAVGSEERTRRAAMAALGEMAGPQHIPGMVHGVLRAQEGPEREAAEKALMFVCNRIEAPQRRTAELLATMARLGPEEQTALLPALGRVGGTEALAVVSTAIAHSNAERHEAGVRALCNWPDASVAPELINLVENDAHRSHRIAALRAVIRIAPLPDGRTDAQKLDLLKRAMSLCTRDEERQLILRRAQAIRTVDTLRSLLPYLDEPKFAQTACQSIVELAHHRELREANKEEFHQALDRVMETSRDAVVIERAQRYKKGQTWAGPSP